MSAVLAILHAFICAGANIIFMLTALQLWCPVTGIHIYEQRTGLVLLDNEVIGVHAIVTNPNWQLCFICLLHSLSVDIALP